MTRSANEKLPSLILDEAEKTIVSSGVQGVNMRDLARRVGVSPTAIYHYYASKEEILFQLRLRAAEKLNARIRGIDPGLSPHAYIEALGREYLAFAEGSPNLYKLLFETPVWGPEGKPGAHPVLYFTYKAARDALRRMADAGSYPHDPRYGAMMGWIMLHGFSSLMMSGVLPPAEGMDRDQLREVFLKHYGGGE
jgi:AcrR family transcriptional regulator